MCSSVSASRSWTNLAPVSGGLPSIRNLAAHPGHVPQVVEILRGHAGLRAGDRRAILRRRDRLAEEVAERQPAAERGGEFERQHPTRYRAGNGERAVDAARRHNIVAGLFVAFDRRQRSGGAAGVDRARLLAGLGDQEEGVAADAVHVRIDDGDGRRRRDDRLEGIAAGAHRLRPGFGRRGMRRDHHAFLADDRLVHVPAPLQTVAGQMPSTG